MGIETLNEGQRKAVLETEGPVMILAGAGSGKTKTLITRIAHLLYEKNVGPYQVLGLTFSNKAAREMRERIASDLNMEVGTLQITTFHSFCAQVLRKEYSVLGLSKSFTIYDRGEAKALAKSVIDKRGLYGKEVTPVGLLYYVDELKDNGYYEGRDEKINQHQFSPDKKDIFYSLFSDYESELHRSNALDFGGLITGVLKLFESFPEILERYQNRFKYVLVDEYQDTNRAQFDLIKLLTNKHRNICVVGDEDQSIYSWRGADIRNILDFDKFFDDVKVIKLEQNYRSTKNIIDAASYVISNNKARSGKVLWTENPTGESIVIAECADDRAEAQFVLSKIKSLVQEKEVPLKDMAVFYRNNSQSRILEEYFRRHDIPFRVVGGIEFYQRKEIKDLISYLKVVVNPQDSLALVRVINTPARGIGAITLRKLETAATERGCSLWEIICSLVKNDDGITASLKISEKICNKLSEFVFLFEQAKSQTSPHLALDFILKNSGYLEFLKNQKDYESKARLDNLQELSNAVAQYQKLQERPTIHGFLESIAIDSESNLSEKKHLGEVSLMTIHGAKGLEFPYVFLVGIEENLFPSVQSLDGGPMGIEEERRLFYVAMTRAMECLFICFSLARMLYGQLKFNGPSRFLHELPPETYQWERVGSDIKTSDEGENSRSKQTLFGRPIVQNSYPPGSSVVHNLYGEGKVLSCEGSGKDEKVLIRFPGGVKKKFMVKYSPISLKEKKSL